MRPSHWRLALAVALGLPMAAQAAPASSSRQGPDAIYQVRRGDTLHELAARYLVRPSAAAELQRLNRISDPRRLPIGRRLTIPARLLRTEPLTATLVAFAGPVIVEGTGAGPLARGMAIREGYRLVTGANGFLTFELPDGSRTTLPSQSRAHIQRLRRVLLTGAVQRDLRLEEGRSSSVVTPMTDQGSRFRIETPVTVSAVRGTEFRANFDVKAGRSTIEVLEGKVAETSGRDETVIVAGYGLGASVDGRSAPQPLLPAPSLDNPGRPQDDPQVVFHLREQAGAISYRAQIASDAGFIDVLAERNSAEPQITFESLPNGTYFARFTALDAANLEGRAASYAFERRLMTLNLQAPEKVEGGRRYLFKWRGAGGQADRFRFILAHDPEGTRAVIDEAGLVDQELVVTNLPAGVYYWRVQTSEVEGGRYFEKWSPPQRFEIGG